MPAPQALARHGASWLARQDRDLVRWTLDAMTPAELKGLPHLWEFWALPHQLPPGGDWRTWVIMGGRGAGKTRAGAEWVRSMVEGPRPRDPGRARRVALLGETIDQAREVMVMGESGLLAVSPPDRRPTWHATRRLLEWPNGATAQLFSAHEPDSLRGPQFDCAWADELAKWPKAEAAWDMLQFGLRLGDDPRACVTTTPSGAPCLRTLLAQPSTVATRARTRDNAMHLAAGFMEEVERRYAGTRLGRQELDGELLDDDEGALWTPAMIEAARLDILPPLDRVVVAVDPAVSAGGTADATGIVVAGAFRRGDRWHAVVIEDATVRGHSSDAWARAVVAAAERHDASRVVAEVNQGGDLVRGALHGVNANLPVTTVHASASKAARAEPVAALYEQGRVHHWRRPGPSLDSGLGPLEDQMLRMAATGWRGAGSPDRLDALVWAIRDLVLDRQGAEPRVRGLG